MNLSAYIQRKLKAPNYGARAGQTIAGALGRGSDGKFTRAGSGGDAPAPTDRQKRDADRRSARLDADAREQELRNAEDDKIAAGKNGKERQALRRQVAIERRKRAMERKRAALAQQQADAAERANKPSKEPKEPKEPKPKGGGGKGPKPKPVKPTDDEKRAARDADKAKLAKATAGKVGISDSELDTLRGVSTGNVSAIRDKKLLDMGFIVDEGTNGFAMSDQGRRALSALERGDQRGYQAAVQDARNRLTRESAAAKRRAAVEARRAASDAKRAAREAAKKPVKQPTSQKSLAVFKDAHGQDRWLAITTTAYEDQDQEYISRKAIADAVRIGDSSGERGTLRYWHVKGFDIGDCDFQDTAADGRMLIESGTFRSKAYAQLGRAMARNGWQMSPGFIHPPYEPRDGVYNHILIFERSACPPGKASNPYTQFVTKETPMETVKIAHLKALTADDPALFDTLMAVIEKTDKSAQESGAVFKDAPAWAQALIDRIDGLEAKIKAGPPSADEMIGAAADEIAATAGMADEAAPEMETEIETEPVEEDGPLLSPGEISAIAQAVAQAIMPLFDLEKKMRAMTDEIKGTVSGMAAQKSAQEVATTATLGALDTRIKQLEGEQPIAAVSTRASADPATILPSQMVEMLKQSPQQVNANGSMPSGDPIATFLSSFNVGNR